MKKINKTAARKLWDAKVPFRACACNMRPDFAVTVRPDVQNWTFETWYNHFSYYNCNSETGRYIAFYAVE